MKTRFQNAEIEAVNNLYAENHLYKAVCKIGPQLEAELTEFGLCPEECFAETQELLTVIAEKGEEVIPELQNLWLMKFNQYRRFDRHVNQEEVRKAVCIVFGFAILAVNTSRHPFYNFTLTWNLTCIVADNTPEGWSHTLDRIVSLQMPDGWFDRFVEEDPWDGNSHSEGSADKSGKRRKKTVTANEKPLTIRYYRHGNKGILTQQRQRVDILYRKWTEWKWIDADTDPDDFDRLFEGQPRHCNIKWTGTSATLTILMQQLLEQDFIEKQTNCSAKHLVEKQFGKTPNSDRRRISKDIEEKIRISILILDTSSPLPQRNARDDNEEDLSDAALYEVCQRQLRSTKCL